MRARLAAVLGVLIAGCGAAPPLVAGPPTEDGPRIVEVATGASIPFDALIDRLAAARVVYVGERHDRAEDHEVQRAILVALHTRRPELAVGLEMFSRPYQDALDAYVAGSLDEAQLLEQTEWSSRWGFDFALYRSIVGYAGEHRLPLIALNAPREITRTIAREGLDALDEATRAALPELDRGSEAHRARVEAALREHPHVGEAGLERFYAAQLVWDETMAESVARHDGPMLVLAGAMHVARDAVPERAARRGAAPFVIVLPEDELPADAAVDYVWLTPR
ncbi:MAG: ChaN family lipoprotein [Sandaracinaceae bacterium]|nr:ChaN family lipoprotein [Sandaracinaceae bacterium]